MPSDAVSVTLTLAVVEMPEGAVMVSDRGIRWGLLYEAMGLG